MSLINQMLLDLERRRGGAALERSPVDGLRARLSEAKVSASRRLSLAGGIVLLALGAALGTWMSRPTESSASASGARAQVLASASGPSATVSDAQTIGARQTAGPAPEGADPEGAAEQAETTEVASLELIEARTEVPADEAPRLEEIHIDTETLALLHTESPARVTPRGENRTAPPAVMTITRSSTEPEDPAEHSYQDAKRLLALGRTADAIDALRQALHDVPAHTLARLLLARELLRQRQTDLAIAVLEAGMRTTSGPERGQIASWLARALLDGGQTERALEVLYEGTPDAQGDAEYLAFTAAIEQRLGRHERAVESYRRLLAGFDARGVWWMGLGISLAATGRSAEAGRAFEAALGDGSLDYSLKRYIAAELARLRAEVRS
jgi:MSHA biogenesis protein MshN